MYALTVDLIQAHRTTCVRFKIEMMEHWIFVQIVIASFAYNKINNISVAAEIIVD